jgi:hypothetical protein
MTEWSYVYGASEPPLTGKKIGAYFDKIAARDRDEQLALIVRHQKVRWTYRELKAEVDPSPKASSRPGVIPSRALPFARPWPPESRLDLHFIRPTYLERFKKTSGWTGRSLYCARWGSAQGAAR